eukprot:scaffold11.g3945.t1
MADLDALPCPVQTASGWSWQERAAGGQVPDIRAYKLGKKRWSYNQVELLVHEAGGDRQLSVRHSVSVGSEALSEDVRESAVCFHMQLSNGHKVHFHAFLCYEEPDPPGSRLSMRPSSARRQAAAAAAAHGGASGSGASGGGGGPALQQEGSEGSGASGGASDGGGGQPHTWYLVARATCRKGCCGPVLRAIQRFGRLGKRQASGGAGAPAVSDSDADNAPSNNNNSNGNSNRNMKDPRFMYLSFDEAGTHVGGRSFRLLAAMYEAGGRGGRLLGAAVSPPVKVLANNDVPTGAAHIQLHMEVDAAWEGWAGVHSTSSEVGEVAARSGGAAATPTPPGRSASCKNSAAAAAALPPPAPSPRPRRLAAMQNALVSARGRHRPALSGDNSGSGDGSNQTHDGDAEQCRGAGAVVSSPGVYRTRSVAAVAAMDAAAARHAGAMRRTLSAHERVPYGHPPRASPGRRSASPSDEEQQLEYGALDPSAALLEHGGGGEGDTGWGGGGGRGASQCYGNSLGGLFESDAQGHGTFKRTRYIGDVDYQLTYRPPGAGGPLLGGALPAGGGGGGYGGGAPGLSGLPPALHGVAGGGRADASLADDPIAAFADLIMRLPAARHASPAVPAGLPPPGGLPGLATALVAPACAPLSSHQHLQLLQLQQFKHRVEVAQYAVLAGHSLAGGVGGAGTAPPLPSSFAGGGGLGGLPQGAPAPGDAPFGMASAASLEEAGLGLGLGQHPGQMSPLRLPETPHSMSTPTPSGLEVDLFCTDQQALGATAEMLGPSVYHRPGAVHIKTESGTLPPGL